MKLNGDVVPGITVGLAWDTDGYPLCVHIIPDSPVAAGPDLALGAEIVAGMVEKLSDIELDVFRESEVGAVEICVVG